MMVIEEDSELFHYPAILVTVCITTYNHINYIDQCIKKHSYSENYIQL